MSELGKFNSNYAVLFNGTGGAASEEVESFAKTFGWFMNLDLMSNNRRELWDYYTDMNAGQMMNHLSYCVSKLKIENGK
ncbi:MAG: hypothetical protein WCJ33_02430 [Pseudomonadota bacterium]